MSTFFSYDAEDGLFCFSGELFGSGQVIIMIWAERWKLR
jgi:hypothetical protein